MAHAGAGFMQCTGEQFGALAVILQQVEGHARCRFDAHAGQAAQRLHQGFKGAGIGHGKFQKKKHRNAYLARGACYQK
ncbi:hypothetical protein D3C72_2132990 [compost metagenome]